MEKKIKIKKYLVFTILFLFTMGTYAQGLPGFGDNVDDEVAAAPIDTLLWLSLILGLFIGIVSLKKITKF